MKEMQDKTLHVITNVKYSFNDSVSNECVVKSGLLTWDASAKINITIRAVTVKPI
jgi:hypothetical protein